MRSRVTAATIALAALLLTTGTWHFASPRGFESIVPDFLGSPAFWVRLSGVSELACAVGLLLIPRTRRAARWASAALFVVVFPANIDMAVHAWHGDGNKVVAYGRLPLQVPLVLWALYIARGTLGRGRCPANGARGPAPDERSTTGTDPHGPQVCGRGTGSPPFRMTVNGVTGLWRVAG